MQDEQDDQPIDLSFNRSDDFRAINFSQSSVNLSVTSSPVDHAAAGVNSSNLHSVVSSTQVSSNSGEVANCFVDSLLRFLLLSDNPRRQEVLKELREHLLGQQEPLHSTEQSRRLADSHGHPPVADSTGHVDLKNCLISRISKPNVPKESNTCSAKTGRPLTGRYVRAGTGASELTLISLRKMIELKINKRLHQQTKASNTQKTSKAHKHVSRSKCV